MAGYTVTVKVDSTGVGHAFVSFSIDHVKYLCFWK